MNELQKKKYILHGGYISSKNDEDGHYISASKLCKLYKLNPKECIFVNGERDLRGINEKDYIFLSPLYNGDYTDYIKSLEKESDEK